MYTGIIMLLLFVEKNLIQIAPYLGIIIILLSILWLAWIVLDQINKK